MSITSHAHILCHCSFIWVPAEMNRKGEGGGGVVCGISQKHQAGSAHITVGDIA